MAERRSCSSIDRLPASTRQKVDAMLLDRTNSMTNISEWLKSEGYEISRSAVWRYSQRGKAASERLADTLCRTQALVAAVEAHPDLDYTKAANLVLMDGLMQKVASAEDEFLEMPLDKAGRLIASLSRNATYEKRTKAELKKKMELAFDQLEEELMSAIKQHPELSEEMRLVLDKARQQVVSSVED